MNRIGTLGNTRMGTAEGIPAIFGDVDLMTKDMGDRFMHAMGTPSPPELSIDARTKFTINRDGGLDIIEITKGHSLDVVSNAAAGGQVNRMLENKTYIDPGKTPGNGEPMSQLDIRTVEGLRQAYPDQIARLTEEVIAKANADADVRADEATEKRVSEAVATLAESKAKVETLTGENETLVKERDTLKTEVAASEKRALEAKIDAEVIAAGLTEVPEWFTSQLYAADDETRETMINDRAKLAGSQRTTEDVTGQGGKSPNEKPEDLDKESKAFSEMTYFDVGGQKAASKGAN